MIRRVPPPRYQANEGRLMAYDVQFEATAALPINVWAFALHKTYIPWDTWDAYWEGGPPRLPATPPEFVHGTYALKTLPKEHERTLEDVTLRLRRETKVIEEEGWTFAAYERHFRYLSPAMQNAFDDILPYLQDPGAYHWDTVKSSLVAYTDAAGLEYPRLSDPGYFAARRLEALNLWQAVECVAQTLAAKWEFGFGECQDNPDPNNFQLPDRDRAVALAGWMLDLFPSLRDGELPVPLSRFVELHRRQLQPQAFMQNIQALSDEFGEAAVDDLFGQVWAQRFGHDALLADLEKALAAPEELIALGWLCDQRLMR